MRRIILLLVSALCYFSDSSASTRRTNRYRVVRSGRLPEVKQYKRNVNLEARDEDLDLDLRSVLEEVIAETNEEPARITEHLTSRESSALKKILARLLSENTEQKTVSPRGRSGRKQELSRDSSKRQEFVGGSQRRQELAGGLSRQEDCDTTFRTEISPQCDTVVETVCSNQTVTRTRPDIKEKCTTRIDQKCRPTKTEIPEKKCSPRYNKKCEHKYKTVEEKRFKEECSEEIRHVCQEKIVHYAHETRPAPSYVTPAPAPEPIFTPTPHPYSGPAPNPRDVTITPRGVGHIIHPHRHRRRRRSSQEPDHSVEGILRASIQRRRGRDHFSSSLDNNRGGSGPRLSMFSLMFKSGSNLDIDKIMDQGQGTPKFEPRPPAPKNVKTNVMKAETRRISIPEPEAEDIMLTRNNPDKMFSGQSLDEKNGNPFTNIILFHDETGVRGNGGSFGRGSLLPGTKTSAPSFTNVLLETPLPVNNVLQEDASLEDRVRQAMLSVLGEVPDVGDILHDPPVATIKSIQSGHNPREKIVHAVLEHRELGGQLVDRPHRLASKEILGGALQRPTQEATLGGPVVPEVPHSILHKPMPPPDSPPTAPPPTVSIVELPAEPGCRSFSTKTCNKIPIVVPKKVPYDECRTVPSVECFFVLKEVDDLECAPVSYEDCDREAVEVPYLDTEEICEDVEFEECVDAEVQVPIKVCREVDPNREAIVNREISGTATKRTKGRGSSRSRGSGSPL